MGKLSNKNHHLGRVYEIMILMVRGLENISARTLKKSPKKVERGVMKVKDENYCSQQTHYKQ